MNFLQNGMKNNRQIQSKPKRYYSSEMIQKMNSLGCAFHAPLLKQPLVYGKHFNPFLT